MVIPASSCLGVRKAHTKDAAVELYGMTETEVLELFADLRRAWGLTEAPWLDRTDKKREKE